MIKSLPAKHDLIGCAAFIAADSPENSERFIAAAEATFDSLAAFPYSGRPAGYRGRLADMRVCIVRRFRNHLVFYRVTATTVEIVRVLHGARDVPRDFGVP